MLGTIIIVLLILALIGGLPSFGFVGGGRYGYGPSGLLGVILIIVVLYLLLGHAN